MRHFMCLRSSCLWLWTWPVGGVVCTWIFEYLTFSRSDWLKWFDASWGFISPSLAFTPSYSGVTVPVTHINQSLLPSTVDIKQIKAVIGPLHPSPSPPHRCPQCPPRCPLPTGVHHCPKPVGNKDNTDNSLPNNINKLISNIAVNVSMIHDFFQNV